MQYAIVTEIKKETEKAYLVQANGTGWLPKSQVKIHKVENLLVAELPGWLWAKNKGLLSIRTSVENLEQVTGQIWQ